MSLEELLLLKFAIDNDVTELPARPSLNDDCRSRSEKRNVVLKISHDSNGGSVASRGGLQHLQALL